MNRMLPIHSKERKIRALLERGITRPNMLHRTVCNVRKLRLIQTKVGLAKKFKIKRLPPKIYPIHDVFVRILVWYLYLLLRIDC